MTYTKTAWVNGQAPAISAANLNNIENGIKDLETSVGTKLNASAVKTSNTTSETDTYSCSYVNDHLVNIGTSVDSSYKVNFLYSNLLNNVSWEQGTISGTTGALSNSTTRIRTLAFKVEPSTTYTITINSGYGYGVMGYSSENVNDYTENNVVAFKTNINTFTTGSSTNYIRIVVGKGVQFTETITPSEVSKIGCVISLGSSIITPSIYVNGDEIYNSNIMNYSTEEQVIGKWIDGKPLYRKYYHFTTLPSNTILEIANVSSLNIDNVVKIYGMCKHSSLLSFRELPFVGNLSDTIRLDITSGKLQLTTFSNWSAYIDNFAIIEYTKTTD